jgi:hypothetical protein
MDSDGVSKVNGELPDVQKCLLVSSRLIDCKKFNQREPHEADVGQIAWRNESRVSNVRHVHNLSIINSFMALIESKINSIAHLQNCFQHLILPVAGDSGETEEG